MRTVLLVSLQALDTMLAMYLPAERKGPSPSWKSGVVRGAGDLSEDLTDGSGVASRRDAAKACFISKTPRVDVFFKKYVIPAVQYVFDMPKETVTMIGGPMSSTWRLRFLRPNAQPFALHEFVATDFGSPRAFGGSGERNELR